MGDNGGGVGDVGDGGGDTEVPLPSAPAEEIANEQSSDDPPPSYEALYHGGHQHAASPTDQPRSAAEQIELQDRGQEQKQRRNVRTEQPPAIRHTQLSKLHTIIVLTLVGLNCSFFSILSMIMVIWGQGDEGPVCIFINLFLILNFTSCVLGVVRQRPNFCQVAIICEFIKMGIVLALGSLLMKYVTVPACAVIVVYCSYVGVLIFSTCRASWPIISADMEAGSP